MSIMDRGEMMFSWLLGCKDVVSCVKGGLNSGIESFVCVELLYQ
jgi:hypothetical protein